MPEWVQMINPSVPESADAPPLVTREAFDEVWKATGWELYQPPKAKKEK